MGARRFALVDMARIGCLPLLRAGHRRECNETVNTVTEAFNNAIRTNVIDIPELHGAKYAVARSFEIVTALLRNPNAMGLSDVKGACCDNGAKMCTPGIAVCENHDEHLFWDAHHPSEYASRLGALAAFYGSAPHFTYPINFRQLRLA